MIESLSTDLRQWMVNWLAQNQVEYRVAIIRWRDLWLADPVLMAVLVATRTGTDARSGSAPQKRINAGHKYVSRNGAIWGHAKRSESPCHSSFI
jgi:hypothetical protein